jgi:hypothetical protein
VPGSLQPGHAPPSTWVGRASLCNHVSCICLISRRLRTVVGAFLDILKSRYHFSTPCCVAQHCHNLATKLHQTRPISTKQVSRDGWVCNFASGCRISWRDKRLRHPESCDSHAINCLASHLESINARKTDGLLGCQPCKDNRAKGGTGALMCFPRSTNSTLAR